MRRLVLMAIAAVTLLAVSVACGGSGGTPIIQGNLDADSKVEVGMSTNEFAIASPRPPFTTLNLVKATGGEAWTFRVSENGAPMDLAAAPAEDADSPYFAWVFFPTATASSRPTFITVRSRDQTVIDVQRVDCSATVFMLTTGGQHTGVPGGLGV